MPGECRSPTKLQSLGMKLAIPYNHDPGLLDGLAPYRRDIGEIFLPAPPDLLGTFRPWTGPGAAEYRRRLPMIARQAHDMGIEVDMVMNIPYLPFSEHPRVAAYASEVMDMGIRWFTLGDLHVAGAIRDTCPEAGIVASTIAEVSTVTRARYWVRQVGVNRVVLPRLLNKQPRRIREMMRVGVPLEVIVNESCIPGCPYSVAHCTALGGWKTTDEAEGGRFQDICRVIRVEYPWEHYKSEILPFSVHHLEGLVTHLKLAGRDAPTAHILSEVERFTVLESNRNSQLGCYLEPDDVWEKVTTCDHYCEDCDFCEDAFNRANPDFTRTGLKWLTEDRPPEEGGTEARPVHDAGPRLSDAMFPLKELTSAVLGTAGLNEGGRVGGFVVERVVHEGSAVRLEVRKENLRATFFAAPCDEAAPAFIRTDRWNVWYRLDGDELDENARQALADIAGLLEEATPEGVRPDEMWKWFPARRTDDEETP